MYPTIKAAVESGFRRRKAWEYGGEEIAVKRRQLVRDPKEAYSRTEWSKRGRRVRRDAEPHCYRTAYIEGRKTITYPVYREDQVEPKRQISSTPPVLIDVLAALWTINRRAKRCRDLASTYYRSRMHGFAATVKEKKLELYELKGQALHYLLLERRLEIVGHHCFPGGNWAEVLRGEDYCFHRPCDEQTGQTVTEIDDIEAKPRGPKEPRLKDALHTVKEYLGGRPEVDIFEWPLRISSTRRYSEMRWDDSGEESDTDGFDYDDDDC